MAKQYFLFKSEPHTYSLSDLKKDQTTNWNNVRNFQARNTLRECKKGDVALIYHSGDERAVVGTALITGAPYADLDPKKKGDWVQVDLKFGKAFGAPISLATLKAHPKLKNLPLIKQSRLSCMKISDAEFELILELGNP